MYGMYATPVYRMPCIYRDAIYPDARKVFARKCNPKILHPAFVSYERGLPEYTSVRVICVNLRSHERVLKGPQHKLHQGIYYLSVTLFIFFLSLRTARKMSDT